MIKIVPTKRVIPPPKGLVQIVIAADTCSHPEKKYPPISKGFIFFMKQGFIFLASMPKSMSIVAENIVEMITFSSLAKKDEETAIRNLMFPYSEM